MAILNIGSLNLDKVFTVDHTVRPGETLGAHRFEVFCGGKGLNQSLALARAGARVRHAGCIGPDGQALKALLEENGVDTSLLEQTDTPTGQAIIQVDTAGQNSILLYGGANRQLTPAQIDRALETVSPGDTLLTQNETACVPYLLEQAARKGLYTVWNPSPFPEDPAAYPLEAVSCFVINEIEGQALTGCTGPSAILTAMARRYPAAHVLLTLGSRGALLAADGAVTGCPAVPVQAVDTTGAGDTFLGYFLACRQRGPDEALRLAAAAAALAVTRKGAAASIPTMEEVLRFLSR